jgi:hypothetical protein
MMRMRRMALIAFAGFLASASAVFSVSDVELAENEAMLRVLRLHQPEKFARLRRDTIFFLSLPRDQQKRIDELDRQMEKMTIAERSRLEKVLERYGAWLDRLEPAERHRIKDAPDTETRLKIVKKMREEEWLKRQPAAFRDKLAKLTAVQRAEEIKNRRVKERKDRLHWQIAARFWNELAGGKQPPPKQLTDLPAEVQNYVKLYLMPWLGPGELNELQKAEGHWPQYPMTLVALADKHPLALPNPRGPKKIEDLPEEIVRRLFKVKPDKQKPQFKQFSDVAARIGLARAVAQRAKNKPPDGVILPHELWPYRQKCLSQQVQDFIKGKLQPVLTPDEKLALVEADAKGVWPDYPRKLKELAEKHNLRVPWQTLPGPPLLWDRYRITPYFAVDSKTTRAAP